MRGSLPPLVAIAVLTAGCGESARAPSPAKKADIASVMVERVRTPSERRLDGIIEAVNQGTVAAQTSGRVVAIMYDVNDFVPAGAVIVRLRATEQRAGLQHAEASLLEASAREKEAQANFRRISDMFERKLVAKAMLDEATAARDAAVARLAAARAGLDSAREGVAYTEIRAPYAGIVTRRHVEAGEMVTPGSPVMSGLSLQYLRVAVDVPQSIVGQVRSIKKAAVYVNDRRIEATHLTVFPEAVAPSNTFRARLDLPENAADLYPGMFVKVAFIVGEADRAMVPQRAVIERGEITAVYVLGDGGEVMLRQIRPGQRLGDAVEVLAGVRAGERVALDPADAARHLATASGNAR